MCMCFLCILICVYICVCMYLCVCVYVSVCAFVCVCLLGELPEAGVGEQFCDAGMCSLSQVMEEVVAVSSQGGILQDLGSQATEGHTQLPAFSSGSHLHAKATILKLSPRLK